MLTAFAFNTKLCGYMGELVSIQRRFKHNTSYNIHAKSWWRQTFLYRPRPCRTSQFGRILSKTVDFAWTHRLGIVVVRRLSSQFALMVRSHSGLFQHKISVVDCFWKYGLLNEIQAAEFLEHNLAYVVVPMSQNARPFPQRFNVFNHPMIAFSERIVKLINFERPNSSRWYVLKLS